MKAAVKMSESGSRQFPETRMSLIGQIREGTEESKRHALQRFVEGYRPALISFLVRCKKVSLTDADDLVQDFILNKIINGKVLDMANGKGRFRNALRVCLQRHLVDSIRKKQRELVSTDVEIFDQESDSGNEADSLDQLWAIAIFTEALNQMKTESPHWNLFFDRVLTQPPLSYDAIIEKHGYENPSKASNFLMTAKRTFNRIMADCVRRQSDLAEEFDDEELEREINFLRQQLLDSQMIQQIVETMETTPHDLSLEYMEQSIVDEGVVFLETSPENNWNREDTRQILEHLLSKPVTEVMGLNLTDLLGTVRRLFNKADNPDDNASLIKQLDHYFKDGESDDSREMPKEIHESFSEAIGFEMLDVLGNVRDLLTSQDQSKENLSLIRQLKEHFNQKGKTKSDELPASVNVTMAFTMIAKFVESGGAVEGITSMRRDVLKGRLERLVDKTWLPEDIGTLLRSAINELS